MLKIIADKYIPFLRGVFEPFADIGYLSANEINSDSVKGADCLIIRTRTKINELLLQNTNVKFIASATIGHDHIDKEYCQKTGIKWINAPGCNSSSVQQYIASVFANLFETEGEQLFSKTLGIIGVGSVGRKIETLARNLGMKALLNDPPRQRTEKNTKFVGLDEILLNSDIITIHTPFIKSGIDKTFHLFNETTFSEIRRKPILINSSRGEIIDSKSLLNALDKGIISKAIIDTWENEPNINKQLFNRVFIGTPHIAGYSLDGKTNGTQIVVKAIANFFKIPLKQFLNNNITPPKEPILKIDTEKLSNYQIWQKAILHTYDLTNDYNALKKNISDFEKLRENYPLRREPHAYYVNCNQKTSEFLQKFGFKAS